MLALKLEVRDERLQLSLLLPTGGLESLMEMQIGKEKVKCEILQSIWLDAHLRILLRGSVQALQKILAYT
jgi:hypothetical protein